MPCFQCGQMNTTTTILNDFGQPVFQCRCVRLAGKIDLFRVSRSIRAVLARERVSVVLCVLVYVCLSAGATKTPALLVYVCLPAGATKTPAHSDRCAHACPCLCVRCVKFACVCVSSCVVPFHPNLAAHRNCGQWTAANQGGHYYQDDGMMAPTPPQAATMALPSLWHQPFTQSGSYTRSYPAVPKC